MPFNRHTDKTLLIYGNNCDLILIMVKFNSERAVEYAVASEVFVCEIFGNFPPEVKKRLILH